MTACKRKLSSRGATSLAMDMLQSKLVPGLPNNDAPKLVFQAQKGRKVSACKSPGTRRTAAYTTTDQHAGPLQLVTTLCHLFLVLGLLLLRRSPATRSNITQGGEHNGHVKVRPQIRLARPLRSPSLKPVRVGYLPDGATRRWLGTPRTFSCKKGVEEMYLCGCRACPRLRSSRKLQRKGEHNGEVVHDNAGSNR